jgi:hypothetical protein
MGEIGSEANPTGPMPVVEWEPPGAPAASTRADYASSETRSRWAAGLIGIVSVLAVVSTVLELQVIGMLDNIDITPLEDFEAWDSLHGGVTLLSFAVYVAAGIAYLVWLHRVVRNIAPLTGDDPRFTPGWSVAWWFVPIFSLFRPYQVVRDAWDRLAIPDRAPGGGLVVAWWLAFLVSNWIGQIVLRLPEAQTVEAFQGQMRTFAILDAIDVVGGVLAILVILEIERRVRYHASNPRPAEPYLQPVGAGTPDPAGVA